MTRKSDPILTPWAPARGHVSAMATGNELGATEPEAEAKISTTCVESTDSENVDFPSKTPEISKLSGRMGDISDTPDTETWGQTQICMTSLADILLFGWEEVTLKVILNPLDGSSIAHNAPKAICRFEGSDTQPVTEPERDTSNGFELDRPPRLRPSGFEELKKSIAQQVLASVANDSSHAPPRVAAGAAVQGGGVRRRSADGSRYNYASAIHGAKLVASNKEAKGVRAVLDEDKDKYLRNPCSSDSKFLVVELSEALTRVDEIVLSNSEFYSSTVREFSVYGNREYPGDGWLLLGNFSALNTRTPQHFEVPDSHPGELIRYVRLHLLGHYGTEFFCTLSLLRVHGVDELESLKEEMEAMRQEVQLAERSHAPPPSEGDGSEAEGLIALMDEPVEARGALDAGEEDWGGVGREGDVASAAPETGGTPSSVERESEAGFQDSVAVVVPGAEGVDGGLLKSSVRLSGGGDQFVLKTLMQKIRSLELNRTLFEEFVERILREQQEELEEQDREMRVMHARWMNLSAAHGGMANRMVGVVRGIAPPC